MDQSKTVRGRIKVSLRRMFITLIVLIAVATIFVAAFLYWQGRRPVDNTGDYVALGSSFAAGIGLGPSADGSPVHCLRTTGGYPAILAEQSGLRLVDMTCSGSTTGHILDGGQLLLGPQLDAVGPATKLVTITSGGNDIDYVGDLMAASGNMGRFGAWFHGPIRPVSERPYDAVEQKLVQIVQGIKAIAPNARVMVINYPAILPEQGNCPATGLSDHQADVSRQVARQLVVVTGQAAEKSGAQLLDMAQASIGHDVCSTDPWVNGAKPRTGTAFHPNAAGADVIAKAIMHAITA